MALTYDANGNTLTDENGNTYTWDALNRMISVTYPSGASSVFAYDGLSRRISIIEKNSSGTVTSTKNYLWIGSEIAEERDASNNVTKRFFPQGEQQSGTPYYYTRDQESSVRELMDSSGTLVSRLGYDVYGVTSVISGTILPTFQWDGMYWHAASQSYQTLYRIYRSDVALWDSRDPLRENAGINLYAFVGNDPVNLYDPTGLAGRRFNPPSPSYPTPQPGPSVPCANPGGGGSVAGFGGGIFIGLGGEVGWEKVHLDNCLCQWYAYIGGGGGLMVSAGAQAGRVGHVCTPSDYSGLFWSGQAGLGATGGTASVSPQAPLSGANSQSFGPGTGEKTGIATSLRWYWAIGQPFPCKSDIPGM
jgi:RHS repeat-associated protein